PCNPEDCGPDARANPWHRPPARQPPPHRQPAACCREHPPAPSPPPAPPPNDAAAPPQSRPAQCGSRGSSPVDPHAQENPEPHPNASAPNPPCGTSGSPQDQTDPPQTAPPSNQNGSNNHAPVPLPLCKARRKPPPVLVPIQRPIHKHACSRSACQSGWFRHLEIWE